MAWYNKKKKNVIEYTAENQRADNYLSQILNAARTIYGRGTSMFGVSPNGKRDYNEIFGYGQSLSIEDFRGMYYRGGYAKTIVNLFPKFCWRDPAVIRVNDKEILVDEMTMLKRVGFFNAIERADIANRIGRFSVLFIGIPDGLDPSLPVGAAKKDDFKGMYFNVYEEDGIEVIEWDKDPASPRFNLPIMYTLRVTVNTDSKLLSDTTTRRVHYSRIVHMAEGAISNSLVGTSSLEGCWNALIDKEKVRGGAGEAYYINSNQKIVIAARAGTVFGKDAGAMDKFKENVDNFQNKKESVLRVSNADVTAINASMASPRAAFDVATEDTAGESRIPIRYLTTKVGGTVTGSEDKASLNGVVKDRQQQECTVWLLNSLGIMSEAGILDLPDDAEIVWPVQQALNEKEASEVTKNKADAFKSVTEGLSTIGGDELTAESVLKEIGMSDIEVKTVDFSGKDELLNKEIEE